MKALDVPPRVELPRIEGGFTAVPGTRVGVAGGDIKGNGKKRDDVVVLVAPGTAAAVVTRSTALAAPCRLTRDRVPGPIFAVVVNAGNANASTGEQGLRDAEAMAVECAAALGCPAEAVLVCSTGVIGVPMPMQRVLPTIRLAAADLGTDGARAARAILTTDLVPKTSAIAVGDLVVGGMAKGSGMIHPNMGTMLGFVATNAKISGPNLQALVEAVAERSFNAVTVDGDTSTNDTLIVQATGLGPALAPGDAGWADLEAALEGVCVDLARAIARDGEGATTLVEAVLMGGPDDASARQAARAVLRSPLVKSAIHGRDPNWGRIVGALGAAGVADLDRLDVDLAGVPVLRGGRPVAFDEARASAALNAAEVQIAMRLPGPGLGRAWGCDLTAEYVKINADYRS